MRKFPFLGRCGAVWFCVFVAGFVFAQTEEEKAEDGAPLAELAKIPASKFTKVVDASTSPDGKLAVAIGSKDGKAPEWQIGRYEKQDGTVVADYTLDPCRNYVVDLKKDRVIGILDAAHYGTGKSYNHESASFIWAPDGRWLAEEQSWKWHTGTCTIHRIDVDGNLVAKLDFLKPCAEMLDTWLQKNAPDLTAEQRDGYAFYASIDEIADNGKLKGGISGQVPKSHGDEPLVSLSVSGTVAEMDDGTLSLGNVEVAAREE